MAIRCTPWVSARGSSMRRMPSVNFAFAFSALTRNGSSRRRVHAGLGWPDSPFSSVTGAGLSATTTACASRVRSTSFAVLPGSSMSIKTALSSRNTFTGGKRPAARARIVRVTRLSTSNKASSQFQGFMSISVFMVLLLSSFSTPDK